MAKANKSLEDYIVPAIAALAFIVILIMFISSGGVKNKNSTRTILNNSSEIDTYNYNYEQEEKMRKDLADEQEAERQNEINEKKRDEFESWYWDSQR